MKRKITFLLILMVLAIVDVNAQYTTEGLYTLQSDNLNKYMSGGTPGEPMPMIESVTDDAKFYIVENSANSGFYNIISLDQKYIASSNSTFGTLIENTEENRNTANNGALVSLTDQGGTYRLESTPGGETRAWNGRRTSGTQVGMGTSSISGYNWILTRIGDLPAPNVAPTDIALSVTAIQEHNFPGALVGTLSATDDNSDDTFTFTFEADTINGADNDAFTITGDALSINASADYETKNEYKINVKVTDAGGLSFVKAFTITISDFVETEGFTTDGIYTLHCKGKKTFMAFGAPGSPMAMKDSISYGDDCMFFIVVNPADTTKYNIITLDGRYVASTSGAYGTLIENSADNRNSTVASVDMIDQATNEYFIETYPIIGDFDGTTLKRWNGQRGGGTQVGMGSTGSDNYKWNLTRLGDVPASNVAPTTVFLSADSIAENNSANDTVGMLSTADANPFDTHTYSLAAGDGTNDADNGAFTITNNVLTINDTADFDTKASYHINIKTTDSGDLSFVKAFIIKVIDIPGNTAPTDITLSGTTIDENNVAGAVVGTFSATDADAEDTFTFTFEVDTTNGADNDAFTITGDTLSLNASADFETKNEYKINVKVTDAGGLSFVKAFTVTVNDQNEAPTAITLSSDTIAEGMPVGTFIGVLSATDVDANSTFTYTLSGADAASFSIVDDSLKSAEIFDFEAKTSYSISVTVSDGELTYSQDFTISINNVVETSIGAIELSKVSFYPNPVRNKLTISGLTVEATAYVHTLGGTLVKVAQVNATENSIDVSNLSSGTYIFKLVVEGGELVTKIIK